MESLLFFDYSSVERAEELNQFIMLKQDCPHMTDLCDAWSFFLKHHKRNICNLHTYSGLRDPSYMITARRSRSTITKNKVTPQIKEKRGLKTPKNSRESLVLDKENSNTLRAKAILKERIALEETKVLKLHRYYTTIPNDFQWCPLAWIFDFKNEGVHHKEDL